MNIPKLQALCEVLGGEHERELRRLLDFYNSHLGALPFAVGDRVALTEKVASIDYVKAYGWSNNKGMLTAGNTGVVHHVHWNGLAGRWQYGVAFDIEWSSSIWPAPEQQVYVRSERRHTFALSEAFLRPATESDSALPPPRDAASYSIDGRYDLTFDEVMSAIGAVT
jgi:hypothetical protein